MDHKKLYADIDFVIGLVKDVKKGHDKVIRRLSHLALGVANQTVDRIELHDRLKDIYGDFAETIPDIQDASQYMHSVLKITEYPENIIPIRRK